VVSWVANLAQKRRQPRRHDVKSNRDVNVIADDVHVISQRIEHDAVNRRESDVIFDATDDVIRQNSQIIPTKPQISQKLETISKIGLRQMSSEVVPQLHPKFGDDVPVSLGRNRGQTNRQTHKHTNVSQILV